MNNELRQKVWSIFGQIKEEDRRFVQRVIEMLASGAITAIEAQQIWTRYKEENHLQAPERGRD